MIWYWPFHNNLIKHIKVLGRLPHLLILESCRFLTMWTTANLFHLWSKLWKIPQVKKSWWVESGKNVLGGLKTHKHDNMYNQLLINLKTFVLVSWNDVSAPDWKVWGWMTYKAWQRGKQDNERNDIQLLCFLLHFLICLLVWHYDIIKYCSDFRHISMKCSIKSSAIWTDSFKQR